MQKALFFALLIIFGIGGGAILYAVILAVGSVILDTIF